MNNQNRFLDESRAQGGKEKLASNKPYDVSSTKQESLFAIKYCKNIY